MRSAGIAVSYHSGFMKNRTSHRGDGMNGGIYKYAVSIKYKIHILSTRNMNNDFNASEAIKDGHLTLNQDIRMGAVPITCTNFYIDRIEGLGYI